MPIERDLDVDESVVIVGGKQPEMDACAVQGKGDARVERGHLEAASGPVDLPEGTGRNQDPRSPDDERPSDLDDEIADHPVPLINEEGENAPDVAIG